MNKAAIQSTIVKDKLPLLTKEEKKDIDNEVDSLVKRITPFGMNDIF